MHGDYITIDNFFHLLCHKWEKLCKKLKYLQKSTRIIIIIILIKRKVSTRDTIWSGLRSKHAPNGDYLFGEFSLADVFFAPVVFRFSTYDIKLSDATSAYHKTMLARPDMQAWLVDSIAETEVVAAGEVGEAL